MKVILEKIEDLGFKKQKDYLVRKPNKEYFRYLTAGKYDDIDFVPPKGVAKVAKRVSQQRNKNLEKFIKIHKNS